jgi:hypothetical protein
MMFAISAALASFVGSPGCSLVVQVYLICLDDLCVLLCILRSFGVWQHQNLFCLHWVAREAIFLSLVFSAKWLPKPRDVLFKFCFVRFASSIASKW